MYHLKFLQLFYLSKLRHRVKQLALILIATSFLAACATQDFEIGSRSGGQLVVDKTSHFVFWGLGQTDRINPARACGGAVAHVETELTVPNYLLTLVTLGIYSPRQHRIYCK